MAFSAALSQGSFSTTSTFLHNPKRIPIPSPPLIRAVKSSEQAENEKPAEAATAQKPSSSAQPTPTAAPKPKKPVYSMKKGQIVRVDKEKYLNSVNVSWLFLQKFEMENN
ncbi:UNVERIFIED_CONTAM: NAD(P)H-quinone oxidoreductase subunit O, chloroplastic [Sesamum radiatum]|uniref:NAD(P)H-quinone oxidoreductase subunit O, chloroplastic n=1 Tax=Sesamum radiatum TaxID=300843 RepID=A0AAW2VN97_SESRA